MFLLRYSTAILLLMFIASGVASDVDVMKAVGDEVSFCPDKPLPPSVSSIIWKHRKGTDVVKAIEWDVDYGLIVLNPRFQGITDLDEKTGQIIITQLKVKHSGVYTIDINSKEQEQRFTLTVKEPVPKPVIIIKKNNDTNVVYLRCEYSEPIIWKNSTGHILPGSPITKGESITVKKNGGPKTFYTCTLDNGVSKRTSDPVYESDLFDDLSAGAVVGICVAVLVCGAGPLVAAASVIYCRRRTKIFQQKSQRLHFPSVIEGESVTLIPYGTEIHKDDDIQWKNEGAVIAEKRGTNGEITEHDDVLDGRFKGRLHLDKVSGLLIIKDTRFTDTGNYELQIIRRGHELLKTFTVTVCAKTDGVETVEANKGDHVILPSGVTRIEPDDQIMWMFRQTDSPIAQIKGGIPEIFPSAAGGRFRNRLKLDQTGSLTIKKIRPTDAGVYIMSITKSGNGSIHFFRIKVLNPKDIRDKTEAMLLHV